MINFYIHVNLSNWLRRARIVRRVSAKWCRLRETFVSVRFNKIDRQITNIYDMINKTHQDFLLLFISVARHTKPNVADELDHPESCVIRSFANEISCRRSCTPSSKQHRFYFLDYSKSVLSSIAYDVSMKELITDRRCRFLLSSLFNSAI